MTIRLRCLFVVGLGLLLASMSLKALDPDRRASQYVTRVWSTPEGLPDPAVRTVIQSRDGYLWLGTHAGLVRFDGRRFLVYDREGTGLGHDQVLALAEDADGRIWIGTEQGLYRLAAGRIEAVAALGSAKINAIEVGPTGQLWIGSNIGLFRVSGESIDRFGAAQGLEASLILGIALHQDQVFVGTDQGAWRGDGERFERIRNASPSFTRAILVARDGSTWIGGSDALLQLVDGRVVRSIPTRFEEQQVWHMVEDRHGNIWLASYGAGIQRIGPQGFDTVPLGEGFANRRPWRLLEDREGNIWAGTREGLVRINDGPAIAWSVEEGLPSAHVRAVFEDTDGGIWVAHVLGVSRISGRSVRNFDRRDGLPGEVHSTILRDRNGTLWVGGAGGLSRFDGERFHAITARNGLPNDQVKVAIETRDGRLWTGHLGGIGLVVEGRASSPEGFGPLRPTSIEVLLEDRQGALWIGTLEHGFWRWKDGKLEQVRITDDAAPVGVRTVHEDDLGRLWIGTTARGVIVLDGDSVRAIGRDQGVPVYGIWSILDDRRGHWWFSSDIGLWQFAADGLSALLDGRTRKIAPTLRLTERDGMKSREANGGGNPSGFIARDGRPWFATAGGAVVVDLDSQFNQPQLVAVRIESAVAGDVELTATVDTGIRRTWARAIDFGWTAIHLANPEALRFRYRLVGQDDDWIDAGDRRTTQYTNLAPGRYRFEIEARLDGFSPWQAGAPLELRIEPFWHERLAVRLGVVLVVLGLAVLAVRARMAAQRRLALQLQHRVDTQTAELRRANAELARIAAVDSLTGIATSRVLRDRLAKVCRADAPVDRVALLLLDVDDFKPYNDTFGHPAGDECLRHVAAVLERIAGEESGLAARYGGEEFALVLPGADCDRAMKIAESTRATIEAMAFPGGAGARHPVVTVSIGVTAANPRTTDAATLLMAADRALYAAKRGGRNRVESESLLDSR